jgi:hypothetical protein
MAASAKPSFINHLIDTIQSALCGFALLAHGLERNIS